MSTDILFFYISLSTGHQHAADAVRESLKDLRPSWTSAGIDAVNYVYPRIGKFIARAYLEMLRHTPLLWDYVYDNPDVKAATQEAREFLNLISWPRMKSLIRRNRPLAIVCTQAAPCSVLAAKKRQGKLAMPLIAVVTDFAIHSYWVFPEVDLYCVPSEEARRSLVTQGVPADRVAVTGIPIHPDFTRPLPAAAARERIGLSPEKPVVMLMGGSQGFGPFRELLRRLPEGRFEYLVLAGMNQELQKKLETTFARRPDIRVLGFTPDVASLMDAADLLVTKPGGLTVSEALVKGLPMVLIDPIPGQEERNARYLLAHRVAEGAEDAASAARAIVALMDNPVRRAEMEARARRLAAPRASRDIAERITALVDAGPISFDEKITEYAKIPAVSKTS